MKRLDFLQQIKAKNNKANNRVQLKGSRDDYSVLAFSFIY